MKFGARTETLTANSKVDEKAPSKKRPLHYDDDDSSSCTSSTASVSSLETKTMPFLGENDLSRFGTAVVVSVPLHQSNVNNNEKGEMISDFLKDLHLPEPSHPVNTLTDFIDEIDTYIDDDDHSEDSNEIITKIQTQRRNELFGPVVDDVLENDFWNLSLTDIVSNSPHDVTEKKKGTQRALSFGMVHVRVYERILGDNPSCSSGPSISIGWRYESKEDVFVDEWERLRKVRKNKSQLIMSQARREKIARKLGYSKEEIAHHVRTLNKCKTRRLRTVHNLNAQLMEEAVERTRRKLSKLVFSAPTRNF